MFFTIMKDGDDFYALWPVYSDPDSEGEGGITGDACKKLPKNEPFQGVPYADLEQGMVIEVPDHLIVPDEEKET